MNKLVRPVRRSLGVLMAIALCLGTSAIWGSPAQAGDVTPGPIKTSSNFELTQLSIVQTVRDAGGKLVPAGEDKTMQVYHTARLSFDWKAPSPAKKGMSFTVSLPETLRGIVGKLTFEYTTCDITADGATMKCVLNDKADGLNQVSGHIDLALDVKKATREKTATVKIDGKAVPIDLPGPGGINPEPSKPTGTRKDGWQVTSDMKNRPNAVNWRIFFSGKTSYEIVDSRVGNNAFIRWWCVKGQDANVAEGRYGEGGVRPAGTLNVKKKSDGTSIANTDPMNRSGLLHEGIVITPPALDYACGIDIIDWDALSSGGVAVNKTDNTAIINGRQYGATAIRKQSGGGSDQGYPYPHIDIVKKDAAGNDANTDAVELAGKNLDAQGVGSTDLKFTVKNDSSVEDLKQVVVTDTTSGSGTVESMACTFPGEKAPTAGVYDAASKKWTVKWDASWKDADPAAFAAGASFPCTAKLTGVTQTLHTDTSTVEGAGYGSGKTVKDENPYNAVPPTPHTSIDKSDAKGNGGDTLADAPVLETGQTDLKFKVVNNGGEPLREIVVTDETVAGSGKVESMACTFPGENAPTKGVYDAGSKKWTVKWAASFGDKPTLFRISDSFACTAKLTGVTKVYHTDTAKVTGTGSISAKGVTGENPYNALPKNPNVEIVKKDVKGRDADKAADAAVLAPDGKTGKGAVDLDFTVVNNGGEALKQVVVTDTTTTSSGTVESMACTFPGEKAPTAGVYDAASKKWTVKWDASWKDADPAAFAAGASFPCTAKLTGVTADQVHTDTSSVEGVGYGSGKNVNAEDPYKAKVPPRPSIDIEKADESGRDADTAGESAMLPNGSTRLSFTVRNTSGEAEKNVVVKDVVAKGGKVSNLSCTFPDGSTASDPQGAQVRWEKSFAAQPAVFAKGASFTCSADLSGVPVRTGESGSTHQDTASVEADGAISGLHTSDTDPYNAHRPPEPGISVDKKDKAGNAADTTDAGPLLARGQTDLVFTVRNSGADPLKGVEVVDETTTDSGTVESMQCTFPGENAPTAGVYDAKAKKWTVKWDASFAAQKPSSFAIGASFKCTAHLSGVTGDVHTDDATIAGVGVGSGKSVSDENPYNARVPGKPNVDIEKVDAKGNDADTVAESVLLPQGKTDLVFTIVNTGNESLRAVEVTDKATGSGKVSDLTCTFPDGTKGTRWEASFAAQNPARLAIGGSFTCTAKLTGVEAGKKHADTATVTGTGFVSGTGVTDSDGYHAHRSPDPTPKPTPSHPGKPTPSKSTPVTPKTAKPKPKLPRTGADVRLLGVVALGLAAAGGVVVAVRRGRKSGDGEA